MEKLTLSRKSFAGHRSYWKVLKYDNKLVVFFARNVQTPHGWRRKWVAFQMAEKSGTSIIFRNIQGKRPTFIPIGSFFGSTVQPLVVIPKSYKSQQRVMKFFEDYFGARIDTVPGVESMSKYAQTVSEKYTFGISQYTMDPFFYQLGKYKSIHKLFKDKYNYDLTHEDLIHLRFADKQTMNMILAYLSLKDRLPSVAICDLYYEGELNAFPIRAIYNALSDFMTHSEDLLDLNTILNKYQILDSSVTIALLSVYFEKSVIDRPSVEEYIKTILYGLQLDIDEKKSPIFNPGPKTFSCFVTGSDHYMEMGAYHIESLSSDVLCTLLSSPATLLEDNIFFKLRVYLSDHKHDFLVMGFNEYDYRLIPMDFPVDMLYQNSQYHSIRYTLVRSNGTLNFQESSFAAGTIQSFITSLLESHYNNDQPAVAATT